MNNNEKFTNICERTRIELRFLSNASDKYKVIINNENIKKLEDIYERVNKISDELEWL